MRLPEPLGELWRSIILRNTGFSGAYRKLRLLYSLEDPWEMASEREQHRFAATSAQLAMIEPKHGSVVELGCGEGHQSLHLRALCERLHGVDLSSAAVARARARCPWAQFSVAKVEAVPDLLTGERVDLITACELLYYLREPERLLPKLQAVTRRIYVSNYRPRSMHLRPLFEYDGWYRLPDIVHGEAVWECFLWEADVAAGEEGYT